MKAFKSGDQVPTSGIYLALHTIPHAVPDREMYVEGSRFPACQICPAGILYRLESPCLPLGVVRDLATAVC